MNPEAIAQGVSSALTLISKFLPLIPGAGGASALIGEAVKTVGDILPLAVNQISATYTGIKNVIAALKENPATTEEQLDQLEAFDKTVDDAWEKVKPEFDPDSPTSLK